MKILVVEDDPDIASNIGLYFEQQGHTLDFAYNGNLGLQLAKEERFDLIILDLMLPGIDGITLCKRLRAESPRFTPVLMLTARDTINDKAEGFEAGADDYLVKPFSLRELEMRVKALTRRKFTEETKVSFSYDELELDPATREVHRSGNTIRLKPKAFAILQYLLQHQDRVVSRLELIDALWQEGAPEGDPLRVHIHHLRQKVDTPFAYPLIQTVHGVGYRVERKPD